MLTKKIQNSMLRSVVEWLIAITIAALFFFGMRNFVFRVAHVSGSSMAPTLTHGDMVILNRFTYLFQSPQRGDIVAFPFEGNPSEHYIKRIIALPGDVVDLRENAFYINNVPLNDEFSFAPILSRGDVQFPITIPDDYYFVLGDNRNGSKDSRFVVVGNVRASDMVGKVFIQIWPLNQFGRVH